MNIIDKDLPVGLCSDHAGYATKQAIIKWLDDRDYIFCDFGTYSTDSCDYPDFAHPCAEAVEVGTCYPGIAICGTGNGIAMTLNKHQGVRAALCWTPELARLARAHNNANILVLPGRFVTDAEAIEILESFLTTEFEGGRHERRIEKIPVKK